MSHRAPCPPRLRVWGALIALGVAASLSACSRLSDFAAISKGNRFHERGLFQDAAAAYLGVSERAFAATVDYDLANVYARLGEYPAAAELYDRARKGGDTGTRADAYFNEGVALYEKGRYEEAWRAFKDAIGLYHSEPRAFPADFAEDARRNLELAWRSWKKRSLAPPESQSPSSRAEKGEDEADLKLLRRLETGRWKPGSKKPAADERGDY
jgi:tetratricopeptide (TPR) repeat protein